jgi:hypothetical protein
MIFSKRFQRKLNIKPVKADLNECLMQKEQQSLGYNTINHVSVWSRRNGHR